jgi:WD40-like Beta Propeller Repeat
VSTTTRAEIPSSGGLWDGVVSPDRRTVAMLRQRSRPARYDMGHPGNPNEIVTLDLRSGAPHAVPGVVLFAKAAPGLAFSSDGRWLVISLDEGTSVRLLLWRPGLAAPLQSPVHLTAKVAFAPSVAALG